MFRTVCYLYSVFFVLWTFHFRIIDWEQFYTLKLTSGLVDEPSRLRVPELTFSSSPIIDIIISLLQLQCSGFLVRWETIASDQENYHDNLRFICTIIKIFYLEFCTAMRTRMWTIYCKQLLSQNHHNQSFIMMPFKKQDLTMKWRNSSKLAGALFDIQPNSMIFRNIF